MAKSTNILKFISILQFSQMYLIFEINVSKEIKKMIAKDCKKTSMCINLVCILWAWAFLKLLAITLWLQSFYLCSSALMRSPSALGDRPGSRPLIVWTLPFSPVQPICCDKRNRSKQSEKTHSVNEPLDEGEVQLFHIGRGASLWSPPSTTTQKFNYFALRAKPTLTLRFLKSRLIWTQTNTLFESNKRQNTR